MLKLNIGLSYPEQSFTDELKKLELASKYNIDFVSVISVDKHHIEAFWESVRDNKPKKMLGFVLRQFMKVFFLKKI